MIATTIKQSKHLLELGLDPNTADCNWNTTYGEWALCVGKNNLPHAVPAWSLTALLDTLGDSQLAVWRLFKLIMHEGYMLCTDSPNGGRSYCAKTKIDAVYKAVVDMLERNV